MPITVWVRLFADLERYRPGVRGKFSLELPEGASIETLLAALGASGETDLVIGVGGRLARRDTRLQDQDEVELLARMAGG
ncbi:MAG: MoaD/ThiS family protein [Chloroflexi bacterium]|nr:MoaD/ThiS family protein [Chloroflexota bacterium]